MSTKLRSKPMNSQYHHHDLVIYAAPENYQHKIKKLLNSGLKLGQHY